MSEGRSSKGIASGGAGWNAGSSPGPTFADASASAPSLAPLPLVPASGAPPVPDAPPSRAAAPPRPTFASAPGLPLCFPQPARSMTASSVPDTGNHGLKCACHGSRVPRAGSWCFTGVRLTRTLGGDHSRTKPPRCCSAWSESVAQHRDARRTRQPTLRNRSAISWVPVPLATYTARRSELSLAIQSKLPPSIRGSSAPSLAVAHSM